MSIDISTTTAIAAPCIWCESQSFIVFSTAASPSTRYGREGAVGSLSAASAATSVWSKAVVAAPSSTAGTRFHGIGPASTPSARSPAGASAFQRSDAGLGSPATPTSGALLFGCTDAATCSLAPASSSASPGIAEGMVMPRTATISDAILWFVCSFGTTNRSARL